MKKFCKETNKRGVLVRAGGCKNCQNVTSGGGQQLGTKEYSFSTLKTNHFKEQKDVFCNLKGKFS